MPVTAAQEAVIRQLFESELTYREKQARSDILAALPSRTPEQQARLDRDLADLAHDRALILQWYQSLRAQGVTRNSVTNNPTLRNAVLDLLAARLNLSRAEVVALFATAWADWQAGHPEATEEERAAEKASLDQDEAGRLAPIDQKLQHIEGLRTDGLTWQLT